MSHRLFFTVAVVDEPRLRSLPAAVAQAPSLSRDGLGWSESTSPPEDILHQEEGHLQTRGPRGTQRRLSIAERLTHG